MIKRIGPFLFLLTLFCANIESLYAKAGWYFIPSDVTNLHSAPANATLSYGANPRQIGELRLPANKGLHPVVIVLHGGCWSDKFADLRYTSAISDALRDLGYATWNMDYRGIDNKDGGWPGTFLDVAQGVDYLRSISKKYNLDLNKVLVIGHSAGGHLALWLGARHNLPSNSPFYQANPLRLRGVIALGGVPDLRNFRSHGQETCGSDVVSALLGSKEEAIEAHYRQASPMDMLPLKTQQILIYGTEDPVAPDTLTAYLSKAKQKGDSVKLIRIPYAGHHEYTVPNSVVWPFLVHEIQSIFNDPPLAIG